MAEQDRPTTSQEQSTAQHGQESMHVAPDTEKLRRRADEKEQHPEGGDTTPHHPDIKQEKIAAKATKRTDPKQERRITNPKDNTSNQYR